MSLVIARRYRPQTFEEVIGQEPIVRTLRNSISSGRIAHGFIFSGHRGIGKTTIARILAKALNCRAGEGPTGTPCGECDSCREIREGNAVDVIEIDAASNRGIDEIRALRERVRYRPARDRYKFFILDEAHQLTGDAFNALLKTLEEPPEWAVFVLATTEPEALPATIRSRCQHFAFRAVPFRILREHLASICSQESVSADNEALGLIAEAGEGSVRDALSLLDQAISHGALTGESVRGLLGRVSSAQIRQVLEAVASNSAAAVLERADALLASGVGPAQLCWQLTQAVRNALVAQCSPDLLEVTESEAESACACAALFREEELARFLQILLRASADLRHGQQERLHFELALIKMLHARRLSGVEDVLASLGAANGSAPTPAHSAAVPAASPPRPLPAQASPAGIREFASPSGPAPAAPPARPAPAAPRVSAAAAAPAAVGDDTAAVLQHLDQQGKAALLSMIGSAQWNWSAGQLELAFSDVGMAKLNDNASTRKTLAEACQRALGRSVEVSVTVAGVSSAPPPPPPPLAGSLEQVAGEHPRLRELRDRIPSHVLRTRAWEGNR